MAQNVYRTTERCVTGGVGAQTLEDGPDILRKGRLDEGCSLARRTRRAGRQRPRPHHPGAQRRGRAHHDDGDLRFRPAPVRGARHVHGRGLRSGARADGHRRGGRVGGHPRPAGRPGVDSSVQRVLRPLLDVRPGPPDAVRDHAGTRPGHGRQPARLLTKLYDGKVPGGQAEFLRVPQAQYGPIKVPKEAEGMPDDRFVYLSDLLPTSWQAVEHAGIPDRAASRSSALAPSAR